MIRVKQICIEGAFVMGQDDLDEIVSGVALVDNAVGSNYLGRQFAPTAVGVGDSMGEAVIDLLGELGCM